ncbi:glycosyltransferase [Actinoplanes sp. G11-F43]|uniref:glycosyltransferase n=1 Tax=Actinoplanes sp. G11-F43 TaxID=3424130 RepID=UPI003D33869B
MVPNVIHFAFTSTGSSELPFSFVHYLAVASAVHYGDPDRVVIHVLQPPGGRWWDAAAELAEVRVTTTPEAAFNCTFHHPAHRADAIRLDTLEREGGIFLDLDVITIRPFTKLLDNPADTILGFEDTLALCPAVILSRPRAPFIRRWIEGYDPQLSEWQGFRSEGFDEFWGEISTRYPKYLAQKHPEEVSLVPSHYFYPVHWRRASCERLFYPPEAGGLDEGELKDSYCIHLWETGSWAERLRTLDPSSVRNGRTVLDAVLSPLLKGL